MKKAMTIEEFAEFVEQQRIDAYKTQYPIAYANSPQNCKVTIVPGRKYTKVDIGDSGFVMIDKRGFIYGIKGYGVINRKKAYGSLDTVPIFYWGGYVPIRAAEASKK